MEEKNFTTTNKITPMIVDHNQQSVLNYSNTYNNLKNEISNEQRYFDLTNLKKIKSNTFLMAKDPTNPITIILRKNITLINSYTFEQIKEISSVNLTFNINNPEEIILFSIAKINYMIIFQKNKICLYNLNIKSYSNFTFFELNQLEENERIISIKPLMNDVRIIFYFFN
jgi:hypothetical protein